jgi:hypothetical protein
MAVTVIGGTIIIAGQETITGYIVEKDSRNVQAGAIKMKDVMTAAGIRHCRIVFQKDPKISLTLIATTGTFSEFPEGAMCTVTALSQYFVDSCKIDKTEGEQRAQVELTNIGIT